MARRNEKKSWVDLALQDDRLVAQQLLCLCYPWLRGLPLQDVICYTPSAASAIPCDQVTSRMRFKRSLPKPSLSWDQDGCIFTSDHGPTKKRAKRASLKPSPYPSATDEDSSQPSKRLKSCREDCENPVTVSYGMKIKNNGLRANKEGTPRESAGDFSVPDLNLPYVPTA